MSKASFAIALGLRKFSNFRSEGSLTQGSGFVPIAKSNLFLTYTNAGFQF